MKRKRKSLGPFVAVPLAILDTPAWRATDFIAQALWIALRRHLRNDGLNNGKIWLSCRDAAKVLGVNKDTITHRYAELEHYGFLRQTAGGFLGCDGHGIATRFRFTDLAHGTHPATRDYEKWDGSLFEYTPRKPGRKNRIPSGPVGHSVRSRRTYGRLQTGVPYVRSRRTEARRRGVRSRRTDLDCHSPLQGKSRGREACYRVAQQ
jgi:DNA-binding transcriptional MocR family regulator